MINFFKKKYNKWLFKKLLEFSGVDVKPDPGVWGLVEAQEEQRVLADLYKNELFISLLKKYAETANKSILGETRIDFEFGKQIGKFLAFNGLILKAKKAFSDSQKVIRPVKRQND